VSEMSHPPDAPAGIMTDVPKPGRRRWQVGLRTLFLLIAAIAVWMAYFINRRHNAALAARIEAMAPLAHELIVDDPKKIAIVKLEDLWMGEDRWEIHVPEGRYRLCLATHGIGQDGLATVTQSAAIAPGRHQLAFEQRRVKDVYRVIVRRDGTELITREEPSDWDTGSTMTTGDNYSTSRQFPPDGFVVLLRRRFMPRIITNTATAQNIGPTDGVLIWIEETAETSAKP
jgi:hypothetical protein